MRDFLLWPIPALFLVADWIEPAWFFAVGAVAGGAAVALLL